MLYKVDWTIDIDADSPEEAARKALAIHRDQDSCALYFTTTDEAGKVKSVDLWDLVP